MYEKTYFLPWIGTDYDKGINSKKILVIEDSYYCGASCEHCGIYGDMPDSEMKECRFITQNIIKEYLAYLEGKGKETPYHQALTKFSKLLLNNTESPYEEIKNLWNSIAFYNFVQTAKLDDKTLSKSRNVFEKSTPAFIDVMEALNPDIVICLSDRVWVSISNENWFNFESFPEYEDLYYVGYYDTKGKKTLMANIPNPTFDLSYEDWYTRVKVLLNYEFTDMK